MNVQSKTSRPPVLSFCCHSNNDLFRTFREMGHTAERFCAPGDAIDRAEKDGCVLILADGYPDRPTEVSGKELSAAAAKNLRLLIEFPATLPGMPVGTVQEARVERIIVSSDLFGARLEKGRILGLHGCRFVPVTADHAHLAVARVAGFDRAVFGLPGDARPVLFEKKAASASEPSMMVATTKLSQFIQGRYTPVDAWGLVWKTIIDWGTRGRWRVAPAWKPIVAPRLQLEAALPVDVEGAVLRDGVEWFTKSRLLVDPAWADRWDEAGNYPDRVWDAPGEDWPIGDGTGGLLEGFSSKIDEQGRQKIRWYLRGDCNAEAAMAHAFAAALSGEEKPARIAGNLLDFVFFESNLQQGPRADPASPSYGLIGWDTRPAGAVIYYGDDNAKLLLGAGAAASLLAERRWDEKILRAILANFRTSGRLGFRGHNLDESGLAKTGWENCFFDRPTHFAPHFECWLWACYLWLYRQSGFAPLLERSCIGLRLMMEAYPENWHWTNGLQQERARMLLPLSWLVRVEDTEEHRGWLRRIAGDLLAFQEPCGAIREEVGSAGKGRYAPPASNEAYGTAEAPLLQENGDPLADMLYTVNFAFVGLREAAGVGEVDCAKAEEKLAEFLCRIQIQSNEQPEFDGAWFRAFDFKRWEFWGSDADSGWGAWCIETGWTQSWICAGLGLRLSKTTLWDLLGRHAPVDGLFERVRREMIPDAVLEEAGQEET